MLLPRFDIPQSRLLPRSDCDGTVRYSRYLPVMIRCPPMGNAEPESGVSWFGDLRQDQAYRNVDERSDLTKIACLDVSTRVWSESVQWLKRPLLYH